jgi:hypothetical protein
MSPITNTFGVTDDDQVGKYHHPAPKQRRILLVGGAISPSDGMPVATW